MSGKQLRTPALLLMLQPPTRGPRKEQRSWLKNGARCSRTVTRQAQFMCFNPLPPFRPCHLVFFPHRACFPQRTYASMNKPTSPSFLARATSTSCAADFPLLPATTLPCVLPSPAHMLLPTPMLLCASLHPNLMVSKVQHAA